MIHIYYPKNHEYFPQIDNTLYYFDNEIDHLWFLKNIFDQL